MVLLFFKAGSRAFARLPALLLVLGMAFGTAAGLVPFSALAKGGKSPVPALAKKTDRAAAYENERDAATVGCPRSTAVAPAENRYTAAETVRYASVLPAAAIEARDASVPPIAATAGSIPGTSALPAAAQTEKSPSLPAAEGSGLFPDYIMRGRLRRDTENHPKGTVVRVLEGQSDCYYLVRSADGDRMAVAWDELTLLPPPALALPEVSADDIEAEAARRGFTSGTDCLLWTCLYRLETYLLRRRDGAWHLCERIPCSVGDEAHPTPTGRYAVATKLTTIGKPDRYLCRNALCFHGAYMYHSVLLSPAGDCVLDGRLGCRISHGCIRLPEAQAAALFETVPCGTAVYIN